MIRRVFVHCECKCGSGAVSGVKEREAGSQGGEFMLSWRESCGPVDAESSSMRRWLSVYSAW